MLIKMLLGKRKTEAELKKYIARVAEPTEKVISTV